MKNGWRPGWNCLRPRRSRLLFRASIVLGRRGAKRVNKYLGKENKYLGKEEVNNAEIT